MKRINGIILLFILLIAGFTTTAAQNAQYKQTQQ